MHSFGFPKREHLVSKTAIEQLFDKSSAGLTVFPLRAVYRQAGTSGAEVEAGEPMVKVLVSVSKRKFHHAVDRNRAKRQMREAYRLHKQGLVKQAEAAGQRLDVAFIWLSPTPQPTTLVMKSMRRLLHQLSERLQAQHA